MLQSPGLPIWNLSNTLVGKVTSLFLIKYLADGFLEMANLDLPSLNSVRETWYGAAVSLRPSNRSPVTSTVLSGTEFSDESVFQFSDLFAFSIITKSSAALTTFGTRGRVYITLSMAIYLLSNNFESYELGVVYAAHRDFFETLDSVFKETPARHLRDLLQSRLASVRATFEALLDIAGILKHHFAFKTLVNIGASNNWLARSAQGHQYLYHAVCMDLNEVVQQLLESGCYPDKFAQADRYTITTAIVAALERRNIQCVELLLNHCDINSPFHSNRYHSITSFTFFIQRAYHLDETLFGQGIKLFLDAGADINSALGQDMNAYRYRHDVKMWSQWEKSRTWSVRDYLFCFHQRLFYMLSPGWSPEQASHPTRAGILMSLESGPNKLSAYCTSLAQNVGWPYLFEYLELLVAEQLTGIGPWVPGPRGVVDLKTVRALVDLGVSMKKVLSRAPFLLAYYMEGRGPGKENDHYCDIQVIRYLLENRAFVDDRVLQQAVRCQNTGVLALTIRNATDIQQQGADALVRAAIANDFEAVKMLLNAGVDVNTDSECVPIRVGWKRGDQRDEAVSLICQVVESWKLSFEALNSMLDYLIQRGAHFRLSAMKPRLSDLLESVLKHRVGRSKGQGLLKQIVQYIMDAGCDLSDPDAPSARLLEACGFLGRWNGDDPEKMGIFESMFRNGALLRRGAPLAAWIGIGGGAELVNEMLCGGADIDAYHHSEYQVRTALQTAAEDCREELVVLLLQKGAAVNAPARGNNGRTALQAICAYHSKSPAEKEQQIRIINILLVYGADINAAPPRKFGGTSLQCAAEDGNLEVAMLLLSWNPPADVNMPPCQHPSDCGGNALDLAAANGRIDMVKLLLNNHALSSRPGDTGYDGAILAAEVSGKLAVADLIREHATEDLTSNPTRVHQSWPQRDWREYEYEYDGYSDEYTTSDEDDEDDAFSESEDGLSESEDGLSESRDWQDPVAQAEIQHEAAVHPGSEHMAPEAGWVRDTEVKNPLNFEIGSPTLLETGDMEVDDPVNFEISSPALLEIEDMEVDYDLDYDPSASYIDTAASDWGVRQ